MNDINVLIKPCSGMCNMRCTYCFYREITDHRSVGNYGFMTDKTAERLIERVLEYSDGGSINFIFQGGEPTLIGAEFYEKFDECVTKNKKNRQKIIYSMQTNGYEISEELINFFIKKDVLIGISLDGTNELHDFSRKDSKNNGTFNKVNKTIQIFNKNNINYNVLCVINNFNIKKAEKIYNYFKTNNYLYIQYILMIDDELYKNEKITDFVDNYAKFLKTTFDLWQNDLQNNKYIKIRDFDNYLRIINEIMPDTCALTEQCHVNIVIEANGNVYPCDFYVTDEYLLGNIDDNNINELLCSNNAKKFIGNSTKLHINCINCKYLIFCNNGCKRYHDEQGLNIFCKAYKEFFDYSMETFEKLKFLNEKQ